MMTKLYFFVSIVTMCLYSVKGRRPLYVGSLLELTNSWASKNAITFPKIWEFAFEEIGNRTDILADYSLQLIVKDTQVIIIIIIIIIIPSIYVSNNKKEKKYFHLF